MKFGYTLLYVDDVELTLKFYSKAFGFKVGFLHESKDYGELITGETKLGFVHHKTAKSHGFDYQKTRPSQKPLGVEIAFVTRDVKKAFAKAVKAGAFPMSPPAKKPWGQVVSYVRDCNGFLVEICSAM